MQLWGHLGYQTLCRVHADSRKVGQLLWWLAEFPDFEPSAVKLTEVVTIKQRTYISDWSLHSHLAFSVERIECIFLTLVKNSKYHLLELWKYRQLLILSTHIIFLGKLFLSFFFVFTLCYILHKLVGQQHLKLPALMKAFAVIPLSPGHFSQQYCWGWVDPHSWSRPAGLRDYALLLLLLLRLFCLTFINKLHGQIILLYICLQPTPAVFSIWTSCYGPYAKYTALTGSLKALVEMPTDCTSQGLASLITVKSCFGHRFIPCLTITMFI